LLVLFMPKQTKDKAAAGAKKEGKKAAPKDKKSKALKAQKAALKGTHSKRKRAIRPSVHFHLPKTRALPRAPTYPRRAIPSKPFLTQYTVIQHPLATETAMKKIEETNTIVFLVNIRANKHQIAEAVQKLYGVKAAKINTLIRPDGKKKAFVRLAADHDALDVANKIGII